MKIDISELKIRKAKTKKSVSTIENKYGDDMNEITRNSFNQDVPFDEADGALVVLYNDKPIGMCIYINDYIYGVCVDKEYRNNGVCRLIMKECISMMKTVLKKEGKNHIYLFSHNTIAQKIYESMGFIEYDKAYNTFYKLKF